MFTEKDLKTLVPRVIYERGVGYYDAGAVVRIERKDDVFHARVEGTKTYRVTLTMRPAGPPALHCTCPYDYGAVCKHGIALGLAVLGLLSSGMAVAKPLPATKQLPAKVPASKLPAAKKAPAILPVAKLSNAEKAPAKLSAVKLPAAEKAPAKPSAAKLSNDETRANVLNGAWSLTSDREKLAFLRQLLGQKPKQLRRFLEAFEFDEKLLAARPPVAAPLKSQGRPAKRTS